MNGGMDYPPNYCLAGGFEGLTISVLRWTSAFWNRIVRGKLDAALLLVANKRTYNALPSNLRQKRIVEFVENGVDIDIFSPKPSGGKRGNVRIIYVGRLVDWKRVDLLIAASARLIGEVNFEVHIVGDGPLRGALEEQVQKLFLTKQVLFHGRLPQPAVANLLRDSDIMVLPSMRECGGAAVLEAMACGTPVIATNWGGPADYIMANSGILISPATPPIFVAELANAILSMIRRPEVRAEMGKAGRQRARTFYDWRVKARALLKIYEDVLSIDVSKVKATNT
jgi:alpha-maltose-1-phosphate synthase